MLQIMLHSWSSAIAQGTILASCGVLLLAAGHDIVSRTVPNWMPLAIACLGTAASLATGRLLISLGLGLAIFIAASICWRRGWMGGADVKLLGAIAIVLPPGMVASFVVAMSVAGAAHATAYMLAHRVVPPPSPLPSPPPRARPLLSRALRAEQWRISRGGPLPYACAIAFGFLFVTCNGGAP
jgi:prepilin peptidase CpaA